MQMHAGKWKSMNDLSFISTYTATREVRQTEESMKLGTRAMEALRAEVTGLLAPGVELIVVGAIALPGTAVLVEKKEAYLASFFSGAFLREAASLFEKYSIYRDKPGSAENVGKASRTVPWQLAERFGADALLEAGESGILAALWKMAEASQVGLEADLRKIPVRQETIEVCERLDVNPYKLFSKGCLLAGMKNGTAFVNECRRNGYPASIIGETHAGNDRLLYSGGNARYLERPGVDELKRF